MEQAIALLTLILLEVVLGIDNVIFISIVTGRLPAQQQKRGRKLGLLLAMVMRLLLLTAISFILKLEGDLFKIFLMGLSGKDLILIGGGVYLLYKRSKRKIGILYERDNYKQIVLQCSNGNEGRFKCCLQN